MQDVMIKRLKDNRLKLVSALCILGDALMGVAGASGLYHIGKNPADLMLTAGGACGLLGHGVIMAWGKGGDAETARRRGGPRPPIFLRPLYAWRYPLDAAFLLWFIASFAYFGAGVLSGNRFLAFCGVLWCSASLTGWLWPEEKKLFGLRSIQFCALVYLFSGAVNILSGLWAHSAGMTGAGVCYFTANFIFYTVRKENQSRHTLEQGPPAP